MLRDIKGRACICLESSLDSTLLLNITNFRLIDDATILHILLQVREKRSSRNSNKQKKKMTTC